MTVPQKLEGPHVFLRKIQDSDWSFLYKISRLVPHSYFALDETTGRFSLADIITQQKTLGREEIVAVANKCGQMLFLARNVAANLEDKFLSFQWMILPGAETSESVVQEGLALFCEALITKFKFNRLHTELFPNELAEKKILEALGFKPEGQLRDHSFVRGRYQNVDVYSLLAEEWTSRVSV